MNNIISSSERRELIDLLIEFEGMSRTAAKRVVGDAKPYDLARSLDALRKVKAMRSAPPEEPKPEVMSRGQELPPGRESRSKKVPYTLLLPPEQLEALKVFADRDDSSVSHHIRQAIRLYLNRTQI
jgi:hypothetical protein